MLVSHCASTRPGIGDCCCVPVGLWCPPAILQGLGVCLGPWRRVVGYCGNGCGGEVVMRCDEGRRNFGSSWAWQRRRCVLNSLQRLIRRELLLREDGIDRWQSYFDLVKILQIHSAGWGFANASQLPHSSVFLQQHQTVKLSNISDYWLFKMIWPRLQSGIVMGMICSNNTSVLDTEGFGGGCSRCYHQISPSGAACDEGDETSDRPR